MIFPPSAITYLQNYQDGRKQDSAFCFHAAKTYDKGVQFLNVHTHYH